MRVYSIFDDYDFEACKILYDAGIFLEIHPKGEPRPNDEQMKEILENYDVIIIGTSQKIYPDMFKDIINPKIIATASVGIDHIMIPEEKKSLITVVNTPKANAQSVSEYTVGVALACCKRLCEGNLLYRLGKDNKALSQKPDDMFGKAIGVVGAGAISEKIMDYASLLGMKVSFWTFHPEKHTELLQKGYVYTDLQKLFLSSDIISVNLPNNEKTKSIINESLITLMKADSIFISVSRVATIDVEALFQKASNNSNFYVCLDIDVDAEIVEKVPNLPNVIITPHIAGGTIETRKRMFKELARQIVEIGVE